MHDEEFNVDLSDLTDQLETDETEVEQESEAQTEVEEQMQEEEPAADQQKDVYTLKHLDSTFEVDRARVTELAQMGLDYERVRGQRDEHAERLKELQKYRDDHSEIVDFITNLSKESGLTTAQMLDEIRTSQYVQKGMSQETAKERVARERAERALANARTEKKVEATEKQKRDADISAFFQKYPGVDPKSIPKEVWGRVSSGESLVGAYSAWQNAQLMAENEQLKQRLEAEKKNTQNRKTSLGSQKTGAAEQSKDTFLEAFLSDD